jgi:hypothetical protein
MNVIIIIQSFIISILFIAPLIKWWWRIIKEDRNKKGIK